MNIEAGKNPETKMHDLTHAILNHASDAELQLKLTENLITAKKHDLQFPSPTRRRSNADRVGGTPRTLFKSMQRDLNRSLTPEEVERLQKTTRAELKQLEQRRDALVEVVASERKARAN